MSDARLTAEQSFSDAAVHHMCGYLRGDYKCERCPRRTQTPYGERASQPPSAWRAIETAPTHQCEFCENPL